MSNAKASLKTLERAAEIATNVGLTVEGFTRKDIDAALAAEGLPSLNGLQLDTDPGLRKMWLTLLARAKEAAAEVCVKRHLHPNDWQTAVYRLSDIEGLHWGETSVGVGCRTTLFGYVWCDGAVSGEVAHSCRHGDGPHVIKVCLPKTLNKENWKAILRRAASKAKAA